MPNDSAAVATLASPATMPIAFTERDAFELALRKAKVYAASTLVPAQYQENLPNCLIALNLAKRIGADELMVMQHLHVVQGKPGWSGQFLIASFNQCGRFTAMRFEWRGQQGDKTWGCRAYATEKATGEKIVGAWVDWKMVEGEGWSKKNGSKWLTMPEQMFHYRSAAFLVRAYAPEIAMGLQTVEELIDTIDVTPPPEPGATKTDAVKQALKARVEGERKPDTIEGTATIADAPSFALIADRINKAKTRDDVDEAISLIHGALPEEQRDQLKDLAKAQLIAVGGDA